ncbi:hypothetical protein PITC_072660 [Penicillium italicum]|uniref:Uncharacterized protein n=1 Tax=Penicillium italicum TaxID=40296 RepID=A0A0A2KE94_PENIT|nr:hypothetical protein PITC_072660 [Penicillium italicum]
MDTRTLAGLLEPCSFDWFEDVEEALDALDYVTQPSAHPITRAIARAIAQADEEEMRRIFSCQKTPFFEPYLPTIEEEGYRRPSQSSSEFSLASDLCKDDNPAIVSSSPRRLKRTISALDLRNSTARMEMATPRQEDSLSSRQSSTIRSTPLSSLVTSDHESSYDYPEISQVPRQKKRDKWKRIVKKVLRKLENLQGANWSYVGQTFWLPG